MDAVPFAHISEELSEARSIRSQNRSGYALIRKLFVKAAAHRMALCVDALI
jgi:hypothetical protein